MRKIYAIALLSLLLLFLAVIMFGCRSTGVESALLSIQQNDWDKALEQLQQAVQVNPADLEAHVYLGEAYGRHGEYQKMVEHYNTAKSLMAGAGKANQKFTEKINNDTYRFWSESFNKGVANVNAKKLAEAAVDFQNCIVIDANRPEAYRNLGYVNLVTDNPEAAIKSYQEGIRINPKDTESMVALGSAYLQVNQYDKTIELMDKVLEIDSLNIKAIEQKAMAYDHLGESDKAFAAYKDALSKQPDDTDLLFNVGRLYLFKNDYEKAIENFKIVLEKNPDDFDSNYFIGYCYLNLAQNVFKKERELDSKEQEKIPEKVLKAKKEQETEYFKNAIPYLEKAVQLKPDNYESWYNLGAAYVNIGMKEKGQEAFDKAEALQK